MTFLLPELILLLVIIMLLIIFATGLLFSQRCHACKIHEIKAHDYMFYYASS